MRKKYIGATANVMPMQAEDIICTSSAFEGELDTLKRKTRKTYSEASAEVVLSDIEDILCVSDPFEGDLDLMDGGSDS